MLTSNLKPLARAKTQEGKDTKLRAESTRANSAFSFSSVVSPLEKKKNPLNGNSYLPNLSSCLLGGEVIKSHCSVTTCVSTICAEIRWHKSGHRPTHSPDHTDVERMAKVAQSP